MLLVFPSGYNIAPQRVTGQWELVRDARGPPAWGYTIFSQRLLPTLMMSPGRRSAGTWSADAFSPRTWTAPWSIRRLASLTLVASFESTRILVSLLFSNSERDARV